LAAVALVVQIRITESMVLIRFLQPLPQLVAVLAVETMPVELALMEAQAVVAPQVFGLVELEQLGRVKMVALVALIAVFLLAVVEVAQVLTETTETVV
jgi:hypothetical protein